MEGLNVARKRGRLGGRPKIPTDDVEAALKMYDSKSFTLAEIEMRTGVKRPTLYLYLNRRKNGERWFLIDAVFEYGIYSAEAYNTAVTQKKSELPQ